MSEIISGDGRVIRRPVYDGDGLQTIEAQRIAYLEVALETRQELYNKLLTNYEKAKERIAELEAQLAHEQETSGYAIKALAESVSELEIKANVPLEQRIDCWGRNPTPEEIVAEAERLKEVTNHWIPCSERLPEDKNTWIFLADKDDGVCPGSYFHNDWYDTNGEIISSNSVTHWMPLPQPPEVNHVT